MGFQTQEDLIFGKRGVTKYQYVVSKPNTTSYFLLALQFGSEGKGFMKKSRYVTRLS